MEKQMKYSQEEIIKNISYFREAEETLIIRRKNLNKEILFNKKQKEFWEKFDKTQLKLF
jgi:hypothetical protein